jgi:hypothetical protein
MIDVKREDDRDLKDQRLCSGCVGEAFLGAEIEKDGERGCVTTPETRESQFRSIKWPIVSRQP